MTCLFGVGLIGSLDDDDDDDVDVVDMALHPMEARMVTRGRDALKCEVLVCFATVTTLPLSIGPSTGTF